jgi:hypothetical protein
MGNEPIKVPSGKAVPPRGARTQSIARGGLGPSHDDIRPIGDLKRLDKARSCDPSAAQAQAEGGLRGLDWLLLPPVQQQSIARRQQPRSRRPRRRRREDSEVLIGWCYRQYNSRASQDASNRGPGCGADPVTVQEGKKGCSSVHPQSPARVGRVCRCHGKSRAEIAKQQRVGKGVPVKWQGRKI